MARRGIMFLLLSMIGGVVGAFTASFISFWLYPELQSDLGMFLRDIFSFGAVVSAAFVWLFYVPALIGLVLLKRRFMKGTMKNWSGSFFMVWSFLLVFISQMHPFSAFANGVVEYLLNTVLAGLALMGAMAMLRSWRKE